MRLRMSLNSPGLNARRQYCQRLGVIVDSHAEGLGDGIGGDVVMGRTDAAGGENIGVAGAQGVQRRDDLVLDIAHHAGFLQIDAQRAQETGDGIGIGVLGATGQDFVADDEDGGCGRRVFTHRCYLAPWLGGIQALPTGA